MIIINQKASLARICLKGAEKKIIRHSEREKKIIKIFLFYFCHFPPHILERVTAIGDFLKTRFLELSDISFKPNIYIQNLICKCFRDLQKQNYIVIIFSLVNIIFNAFHLHQLSDLCIITNN